MRIFGDFGLKPCLLEDQTVFISAPGGSSYPEFLQVPFSVEENRLLSFLPLSQGHLSDGAHFGCLSLGPDSFCHYAQLMSIGEGWLIDRLINQQLYLLAQLSPYHFSPVHLPMSERGRDISA